MTVAKKEYKPSYARGLREHEQYGDAIRYLQENARELELSLSFVHRLRTTFVSLNTLFCLANSDRQQKGGLEIALFYESYTEKDPDLMNQILKEKRWREFDFSNDTLQELSRLTEGNLLLRISAARRPLQPDMLQLIDQNIAYSEGATLWLKCFSEYDSRYVVDAFYAYEEHTFDDVFAAKSHDYRPFLRRLMELYADVPQAQWKNPKQAYIPQSRIDAALVPALQVLFRDEELANVGCSVPRMNLGMMRMPQVTLQIPALLQHLQTRMPPAEAHELLTRKLAKYVIDSGFQDSPQMAQQMLNALKSTS